MPDPVTDLALRILNQPIDDIPRYRLLRDVLHEPPSSRRVEEARTAAMSASQVRWLADQQLADGSWGTLQRDSATHFETMTVTANYSVAKAVRTTDHALQRAAWLGMDRQHPTIRKALAYLESQIDPVGSYAAKAAIHNVAKRDNSTPSLTSEKVSERDKTTSNLTAANIAKRDLLLASHIRQFDEDNPFAGLIADRWKQLLSSAFSDGTYSELRYLESYEHLFGHSAGQEQNLAFSRPVLMLMRGLLPYPIEEAYTRHLMNEVRGIVGVHHRALHHLPLDFPSLESMRFLSAVELLAVYPSAEPLLDETKSWLWEQMSPTGRWDLGKFGHDGVCLPLSANWRRPFDRQVDSTVRMLLLLQNMQISCDLRQNLCHTR